MTKFLNEIWRDRDIGFKKNTWVAIETLGIESSNFLLRLYRANINLKRIL